MTNNDVSISFLVHKFQKAYIETVKKEIDVPISNPSCHFVLMCLTKSENGLTASEICEKIKLKKPSVSLLLQQMEGEGYISKELSQTDKRVTYIKITQKGIELEQKIKKAFDKVDGVINSLLTKEEAEMIKASFNKLINALNEKKDGDLNV